MKKLVSSLVVIVLVFTLLPFSVIAKSAEVTRLLDLKTPQQMKKHIDKVENELLLTSSAYGILNAVAIAASDTESIWYKNFIDGKMEIQSIIPIFDLDENLFENLIVFNEGYIIVDAFNGEIHEYSFGSINKSILDNAMIYSYGLNRFGVDDNGLIITNGSNKGEKISKVKSEIKNQLTYSKDKTNKKWGQLSDDQASTILLGFEANIANSRNDYITNPTTWLYTYYSQWAVSDFKVTNEEDVYYNVPEILQSDYTQKDNDCAVISTLEIMKHFWGALTSAQLNTAYNAMINSDYFIKPDGGVQYYDNNALFKVGSESIGKPEQDTKNDPENLGLGYDDYKSLLLTRGPGYVSMNQEPYLAHTLTVKGYAKYKTTYKDKYYIVNTHYDHFLRVNDHYSITSTDAYLSVDRLDHLLWYSTFLIVER